jgi:arsenate reductase
MEKFLSITSAINDETRVRILKFLIRYHSSCVCDLVVSFEMIQSRLSRHLKILKDAGFLDMKKDKKMSIYYLKESLSSFQKEILKEIDSLDIDIPTQQKAKECKMDKKVLVLCTGNSCRSIMAEALINEYLDAISADSSGVKATGMVNKNAIQALNEININTDGYYSKTIDKVIDNDYDLVVTVCDHANETCPMFPKKTKVLHMGFEDPTGKEYIEYTKARDLIKETLLPKVQEALK